MIPDHRSILIGLSATLAAAVGAQNPGTPRISPADRALFEGATSSSYPLGRWNHRLQQIHADLGPTDFNINGHAYRRDAIQTRDGIAAFRVELTVLAATAAHGPDQASRDFAANLGSDATTVLPRTWVDFPGTGRPADAPAPGFDFSIPWATPFTLAGGSPLCVDVTVHANQLSTGNDRNFSLPLDAHDYPNDGSVLQPGRRLGTGCAAAAASRSHSARLDFIRDGQGQLSLEIDSRYGVPSGAQGTGLLGLLVGVGAAPVAWPTRTDCLVYPQVLDAYRLGSGLDPQGDWAGSVAFPAGLPAGARFHTQLVSGIVGVDLTFSEGVVLDVPPLAPASLPGARIASGSDRAAAQGTVSRTVTVTRFF